MVCDKCKSENVLVIDTRDHKTFRRRRYKCNDCGGRFSTLEGYENAAFFLDGRWGTTERLEALARNLEEDAADLVRIAKVIRGRRGNGINVENKR